MLRLTPATAKAFHAQVETLAMYCHLTARTLGTTAKLVQVQGETETVVAESVPAPESIEEAVASLRNTAIALGLLPRINIKQLRDLTNLYNQPEATWEEKKAIMPRLNRLYADEAQQLFDDFAQVLNGRNPRRWAVVGEAFIVQPLAA